MVKQIRDNKQIVVLFLTAFLVLFSKLWHGYFEGDESCYATLAREVLRSGNWLVLHHPYYVEWSSFYEHPPLNMLLMAINFELFGISDHVAKLNSAFMAFFTIVLVFLTGRKLVNKNYGYIAAFILLTTQYFVERSRAVFLDVPFGFFMILGFFMLILAIKDKKLVWALLSGIVCALALLVKGIPAVSAIAIALIGFVFFLGSWKKSVSYSLLYLIGLGLIILPWIWAQYAYDQGQFFDWYLFNQVGRSMAGRNEPGGTSYLFYFIKLFQQIMVPWFLFSITGSYFLLKSVKRSGKNIRLLTLFAAISIVVGFSVVKFRRTEYIIPALPFLSLLAAEFFFRWQDKFILWANRLVVFILVIVIFLGLLTPLPFAGRTNNPFTPISSYVNAYTVPGDTVLAYSEDVYAMRQMISWYLDRPHVICEDVECVFEKLQNDDYKVAIVSTENELPHSTSLLPVIQFGQYYLFINDTTDRVVKLDP